MISGAKILVTGATGSIARPMARSLARENEVWGAARFSSDEFRQELEQAGVKTAQIDLETHDLSALPRDFDYVLHYAFTRRPSGEFHAAVEVNAIGTGLVLAHCRSARAALVFSAATLYTPKPDPFYAYREEDDIGAVRAPWGPSSPVSKVSLEAVARFCAQAFELPTTIVRPSVPYGCDLDMVTTIVDSVLDEKPILAVHDPQPLSVIHLDDMCEQVESLLDAASVPARILNWAADEVFSVQEIAALVGSLTQQSPQIRVGTPPGVALGAVVDTERVRAITGPCKRQLREALPGIIEARRARSRG
ncbi:MAG: NAD(P)-dependent oxidoreductase [Deltaproteobacteria bacterium]|jgi:nucleoside-diphosphate-sugar epimerase|nr:NAD(P)-dependent oxidoreductase [Deltaproteobacteria bacterium]